MKKPHLLFPLLALASSCVLADGTNVPKLADKAASLLKGRVTGLERISARNARGRESCAWRGFGWRNERVHMPFVVWSDAPAELTAEVGALRGSDGAAIPARVRWVGEVIVDDVTNFQWKAENGPVEMTFPATDDQRFWKVMAFPGEIPSEAD